MVVDVVLVIIFGFLPEPGFGVDFVSEANPGFQRVVFRPAHIELAAGLYGLFQLFFDLCLGLAQDILVDRLAGLRVATCRVSPLPPAVFPLADVALAVGPFLCRVDSSFCSNTTYRRKKKIARGNGLN